MDTTKEEIINLTMPSEEETNVEVENHFEKSDVFHFDRHRIQSVAQNPEELQSLGIIIYDQDTFERGVLEQVDEALERQNRRTQSVVLEGISTEETTASNDDTSGNICEVPEKVVQNNCTDTLPVSENGDASREDHHSSLLFRALKRDPDETEYQRKIRLGEMTPFGSVVDKKDSNQRNDILSNFNGYFQRQIMLQKEHECLELKQKGNCGKRNVDVRNVLKSGVKNQQKNKSPLKKNILLPPKKKRKEKLGCTISSSGVFVGSPGKLLSETTTLEDSDVDNVVDDSKDSDYKPDDSEEEIKLKSTKLHTIDVFIIMGHLKTDRT